MSACFPEVQATARSFCQRKLILGVGINDAPYNISREGRLCPIYKALKDERRHYIADNAAGQQALFRVDGVVEIKPHRKKGYK